MREHSRHGVVITLFLVGVVLLPVSPFIIDLLSPFTKRTYISGHWENGLVHWKVPARTQWPGLTGLDSVWLDDGAGAWWYENGTLEAAGFYEKGLRHGPWVYWDSEGGVDQERSGYYSMGGWERTLMPTELLKTSRLRESFD